MTHLQSGGILLHRGEGRLIPGPEGLTVKAGSDETGGSISVMEGVGEPGFGPPLHAHHGSEELFYVLEGEWDCQVGDERVHASPGSFTMIPRGTVHAPRVMGSEPGKVLTMFAPGGPEKAFDELVALAGEIGGPPAPDDERVHATIRRYDSELVGPPLA